MAEMETHHQAPQLDTAQRRAEDVLHALRGWEPNLTATAVAKDIHTLVKYAQQVRRLALAEAAKLACPYCNDPAWPAMNSYGDHESPATGSLFMCKAKRINDRLREGVEGV